MIINIDNEEPVGIGKSRSKNFDSPKRPPAVAEKGRYHGKAEAHVQQKIDTLNARVKKASLRGAWQRQSVLREDIQPWVWRWKDILPNILEAGNLIPIDDSMKMRTIHMVNPSGDLSLGATRTFAAMLQHLNPGEVTESHRHTASSVYFMIQGSNLYTTADGEQQFMEPGDLLTQPNWTWHGSTNTGSEPAIWFTAMDSPLTQYLNAWFNEK